jgi:hypothetical protein
MVAAVAIHLTNRSFDPAVGAGATWTDTIGWSDG